MSIYQFFDRRISGAEEENRESEIALPHRLQLPRGSRIPASSANAGWWPPKIPQKRSRRHEDGLGSIRCIACFPLELMLQGRPFAIGERC